MAGRSTAARGIRLTGAAPAARVGDMNRLLGGFIEDQQPQPFQNLLQGLMGGQPQQSAVPTMNPMQNRTGDGRRLIADIMMGIGAGLSARNPAATAQVYQQQLQDSRQNRQQSQMTNATAQWLRSQGREDLIPLVEAGMAQEALRLATQKAEMPSAVQEYEYARQNGFQGSFADWKQAGRQSVTVNNQIGVEPSDSELRKGLDKQSAELWGKYLGQGTQAAQMTRDLDMIDELLKVAPQGPLEGRLAQALPGYNNAADALQSIVSRVAPTLRVEGSGSTSDMEMENFLRSLPSLRNQPGANVAISKILRAKAEIDLQRAQIITAYQNNQITASDARNRISQLDRKSIMTPELQSTLGASVGTPSAPPPPDVDPDMWEVMTPEERALWQR